MVTAYEPTCEDNVISLGDARYDAFLRDGEGHYFDGRTLWLDLEPGEAPRPVMDGFVYGRHAFLPRYAGSPKADRFAAQRAGEMVELDARRARDAAGARSIPTELHPTVLELSATLSQRAVAQKLASDFKVKTSHAAVGRLVRQLRLAEGRARQGGALLEEVEILRVQLGQTFDTIMDLQADLLDEPIDREETESALRAHHRTAALLERRLRSATRDLATSPPDTSFPHPGPEAHARQSDVGATSTPISPLNASERGPGTNPQSENTHNPETPASPLDATESACHEELTPGPDDSGLSEGVVSRPQHPPGTTPQSRARTFWR